MLGRGNQLREGKNEPRVKSWKEKLKWLRLSNQMLTSTSPIRVRLLVLKTVRQYYIYSDGYRFLCRATGRRSWLPFVWLLTLLPYDADSRPGKGSAGWYELHVATRMPNTVRLHPQLRKTPDPPLLFVHSLSPLQICTFGANKRPPSSMHMPLAALHILDAVRLDNTLLCGSARTSSRMYYWFNFG
jgi:hypothetical protein